MTVTSRETLLVATSNEGKRSEFAQAFSQLPYTLLAMPKSVIMPEETGATFQENAYIKARSVCLQTGLPTLADDSGLEVEALHGAPGVYSARYAGLQATDLENNEKLLAALAEVPEHLRAARFVCSLVMAYPDGRTVKAEGVCSGRLLRMPIGSQGFGYDPLFFYPPLGKTFGEMSLEEKSTISHRSLALHQLLQTLTPPV